MLTDIHKYTHRGTFFFFKKGSDTREMVSVTEHSVAVPKDLCVFSLYQNHQKYLFKIQVFRPCTRFTESLKTDLSPPPNSNRWLLSYLTRRSGHGSLQDFGFS